MDVPNICFAAYNILQSFYDFWSMGLIKNMNLQ